jgi:glucose-1-phosphate thymidylyltransferase
MKVVILAAGYGTRLYPLTLNLPKPLVKINRKPIINFLVEKFNKLPKNLAARQISVVSNEKFHKNFLSWNKKYKFGIKILNDGTTSPKNRLGAIGDISFAISDDIDDWLVIGGDNLFEDDLTGMLEIGLKKNIPVVAVYDVKDNRLASNYGVVKVNKADRILELKEKPVKPESTLISSCVYFFPKKSLALLKKFIAQGNGQDASGKYIAWLAEETKVQAYKLKGRWIDIGSMETLKGAAKLFK